MTDSRQHRVDTLRQAARRKSEAKTKTAEAAIRTLVKRGEPVTFQSVQREAVKNFGSSTFVKSSSRQLPVARQTWERFRDDQSTV